jgi:hypothetical protein
MHYTVIFRTGGTERFQWHRVATASPQYDDARLLKEVEELHRAGYEARIALRDCPLPTDYEGTSRSFTSHRGGGTLLLTRGDVAVKLGFSTEGTVYLRDIHTVADASDPYTEPCCYLGGRPCVLRYIPGAEEADSMLRTGGVAALAKWAEQFL